MKKVIVASTNPVKINATKNGFEQMFPDESFDVVGASIPSGVSDQPMGEEETIQGAMNRVQNAMKEIPDAEYWIGIEGGLKEEDGEMAAFAWIIVKSKDGNVGKGRTGSFFLPDKIVDLIKEGKELGEADDIVFGLDNSKQKNGTVGTLTKNLVTRTTYYDQAVIFALIPFVNNNLY